MLLRFATAFSDRILAWTGQFFFDGPLVALWQGWLRCFCLLAVPTQCRAAHSGDCHSGDHKVQVHPQPNKAHCCDRCCHRSVVSRGGQYGKRATAIYPTQQRVVNDDQHNDCKDGSTIRLPECCFFLFLAHQFTAPMPLKISAGTAVSMANMIAFPRGPPVTYSQSSPESKGAPNKTEVR